MFTFETSQKFHFVDLYLGGIIASHWLIQEYYCVTMGMVAGPVRVILILMYPCDKLTTISHPIAIARARETNRYLGLSPSRNAIIFANHKIKS